MSANDDHEQRGLLDKGSKPPDTPPSAEPASQGAVQFSPARHRPGYARVPSVGVIDEGSPRITAHVTEGDDALQAPRSSATGHGLGIAYGGGSESSVNRARRVSIQSIKRTPLPSKAVADPQGTPESSAPLMSPPSTGGFSGSTHFDGDIDTSYSATKHVAKQSVSSLQSIQPSLYAQSDGGLLSLRSKYDDFDAHAHCRSRGVKQRLGSWVSVTILGLAVFSTLFSAIYLVIALRGPRYGHLIHTKGTLTASTAAFLTSFFAKLIELSFVTVFVAFLGQILARRAFREQTGTGVTLAELSMRAWVMQPGTIFTQWESVRYAGVTGLGLLSLLAALVALLYSTAATALVQPQLKFPQWSDQLMYGLVKTQFANPTYIQNNCQTPITSSYDPTNNSLTCIQLEHAAMAYHNYFGYLGTWTDIIYNGSGQNCLTTDKMIPDFSLGSSNQTERPKGHALINDNTTVIAPFVESTNMTQLYEQYHGVVVNNVSMAMPHSGVLQAAIDPINNILQPDDLDGLGVYSIRASVPSPVVNVLCITLNETQLKPFVYELWDGVNTTIDTSTWPAQLAYPNPYLNGTPFDDIFGWGEAYGEDAWPPVFAKLPKNFNTLFNDTTGIPWGRKTVFVLAKGGEIDDTQSPTYDQNYALCQLKVSQTPYCWTQYNASASGGTLEAICADGHDPLQYINSLPTATSGNYSVNPDWPNIASEWGTSLSLNEGLLDGDGANSRLLTQLIVTATSATTAHLNPALPSIAEALAVMAGCTLLQSSQDAPFVEFWNYTLSTMTPGQHQAFNASTRAQQYASGGTQDYQKAFYLVLFTVCVLNVIVLVYFVMHKDWYTDFSEPTHLFTIGINSPPSKELAGSCGGGPQGNQLRVNWKLNSDGGHVYMESREADGSPGLRRRRFSEGFDLMMTPVRRATEKFESMRGQ